jgi:hypothetical protein
MTVILSLKPVQRFLRIRRLLREVRGQRALMAAPGIQDSIRQAAEHRLTTAMTDLVDELNVLDEAGVLTAVAECFALVFGGNIPASPDKMKTSQA